MGGATERARCMSEGGVDEVESFDFSQAVSGKAHQKNMHLPGCPGSDVHAAKLCWVRPTTSVHFAVALSWACDVSRPAQDRGEKR